MNKLRAFLVFVLLGQLAAGLYFFAVPLAQWFSKTLPAHGWGAILSAAFFKPLLASLCLAALSGFFSTLLAFTASWWLWRYRLNERARRAIELCLKLPYLLPGFFFAMGWIALAAPQVGYFRRFVDLPSPYGFWGIVWVETLWTSSLAMIQLQSFFQNMPTLLEDAALLCGASPRQAFFKITLPIAARPIAGCVLLTMASSIAAFGVPAMMGLPAHAYVVTTRIFQDIKTSADFSEVSLLALLLLAAAGVLIVLHLIVARSKPQAALVSGKSSARNLLRMGPAAKTLGAGVALLCFCSTIAPLGAVLLQSFLADRGDLASWSLAKYAYVFSGVPDGRSAAANSLTLAVSTALFLTFLGFVTAYAHTKTSGATKRLAGVAGSFWNFAYATPGTLIALPLLVFFQNSLANTLWILGTAFAVKYAAFAVRTLEPALTSIDASLEEAAWMCGAAPERAFRRIIIPLCFSALSAALALSLIPMLSELTMSIFLVGAGTETLGTLIYRFQEYADPGAASVLAVAVAAATLTANFGLKRMSRGRFGI